MVKPGEEDRRDQAMRIEPISLLIGQGLITQRKRMALAYGAVFEGAIPIR